MIGLVSQPSLNIVLSPDSSQWSMCSWIQILILVLLSLLLNVVLVVLVILVIADSVAFAAATAAITFDVTVCVLVVLLNRTFPPLYVLYVVCKVPQGGLEKICLGNWGITWNSLHIIIDLFLPQLSQVGFLLHWHLYIQPLLLTWLIFLKGFLWEAPGHHYDWPSSDYGLCINGCAMFLLLLCMLFISYSLVCS